MFNKRFFFSLCTLPVAILCHESSEYQGRRKKTKEIEAQRRLDRLNSEPIDMTPQDGKFAFSGMNADEIEDKYGFKKVKVKGIIDFDQETKVKGIYRGEEGYFIFNPLYTHVNEKKEGCGIMVNRGFVSEDLTIFRDRRLAQNTGEFEGIIYPGDKWNKYDFIPNSPNHKKFTKAVPSHLSLMAHLKNREDSDRAMLMLVEFDDEAQQLTPSAPRVKDLTEWKNTPERHATYQSFWKYTTYFNLFANTMFWLYF
ncbi:unnamed protein product [Moneuplotes crassus]|uniref:SURF1-like protein n=2 Tax=Euplotes crassus TaxID=5936 RepID=A0AAD1XT75_EUPCR|nr:unnamed protein product [Moneuplotes crassus]